MMKNIKEALLIFATVALVLLSIGIFSLKEKQKALKIEATSRLDAFRLSLSSLLDDVKDKERLKGKLEKRLDETSRESVALEVQLSQIKKISDESKEQLAVVKKDISTSRGRRKDLLVEKQQLLDKISSAESAILELEDRVDTLKQTTSALERHLRKMIRVSGIKKEETAPTEISEAKIEPEPVVGKTGPAVAEASTAAGVDALPADAGSPYLGGEVLVVNREFNFIVVSLGKRDGLEQGDCLAVYDGNKLLGEVFVETVRENISAASGGKNFDAYRIKAGNKVSRKGV